MTFQEFLEKLREKAKIDKFYLYGYFKRIRTVECNYCPIEAVAGEAVGPISYTATQILKLSARLTQEIILAADNLPDAKETRLKLLEACGLLE